jgi:thiol-disulfide isomerase/thioredoxin
LKNVLMVHPRNCFPRWFLLLLVLGVSGVLSSCSRSGEEVGLNPGDLPPEIAFPTLEDPSKILSMRSLKGKVVLINFWASWCAPCVAEMPELQKLQETLGTEKFTVLAVGIEDSPENLAKVKKRFNLTFPIVVDRVGDAKRAYKLVGFPESFILDTAGKLVMIMDPDANEPVVRTIGPREWARDPMLSQIRMLTQGAS